MEKMTYKNAIAYVLENHNIPDEIREKLTALSASLDHKRPNKLTKEQEANLNTAEVILNAMEKDTVYSGFDLRENIAEVAGFTPQKLTAIMRILIENGKVTKGNMNGKTVYTKAG